MAIITTCREMDLLRKVADRAIILENKKIKDDFMLREEIDDYMLIECRWHDSKAFNFKSFAIHFLKRVCNAVLKQSEKLKLRYKIIGIVAFLLCLSSISYAMAAPQLTRSIFVEWSSMQKIAPNIYVNPQMKNEKREALLKDIASARERVSHLFGDVQATPTLILSDSLDNLRLYASGSAQTYSTVVGNIIVLGPAGLNVNIISHELTHAELHQRIGNKIPAWFDEGLATMVDGRYTSHLTEQWLKITKDGINPPDFSKMVTHEQFERANNNVISTYIISCYEVKHWYDKIGGEGFHKFLKELAEGKDFESAYSHNKNR